MWQEDDLIAQGLKPNLDLIHRNGTDEFSVHVKTTEQGLRDMRVYQIPKPANTFRILMLGDSFTFGHGVEIEQTFSKVLEKSLKEKWGKQGVSFEVVNAGYSCGFTWDEYYLCLRERGLKYEPDLVVINTWVGNDLREITEHNYEETPEKGVVRITSKINSVNENNFLAIEKKNVVIRPGVKGLKDRINSLCYKSLFCETKIWPLVEKVIHITNSRDNQEKAEEQERDASALGFVSFLFPELPPKIEAAWRVGQKALLGISQISRNINARFMIVNIPVKFEIYDPDNLLKKIKINGEELKFNNKRIEDFARKNSMKYCSPLELLKQSPESSYFAYDSHLTAKGQELVAKAIEDCLGI